MQTKVTTSIPGNVAAHGDAAGIVEATVTAKASQKVDTKPTTICVSSPAPICVKDALEIIKGKDCKVTSRAAWAAKFELNTPVCVETSIEASVEAKACDDAVGARVTSASVKLGKELEEPKKAPARRRSTAAAAQ